MANPTLVACPADTWTKVATNISTGQLVRKSTSPHTYYVTYRDTGDPAPANLETGVVMEGQTLPLFFNQVQSVDVYVYPTGRAGSVQVQI